MPELVVMDNTVKRTKTSFFRVVPVRLPLGVGTMGQAAAPGLQVAASHTQVFNFLRGAH